MSIPDKLWSESADLTLSGNRDIVDFYHGLLSNGSRVEPDHAELKVISSQEAGTSGASPQSRQMTPGTPANNNTVTVGGAAFNEVWTFKTTAVLPFEVQVGASVAASMANLAAKFNLTTQQNLYGDVTGGNFRIRGSVVPGKSTLDNGIRDTSVVATTVPGAAWAAAAGGAGRVSGSPSASLIYKDAERVRFRVRGLEATDSLTVRVVCWKMHSSVRPEATVLASGTDGKVTLATNQYRFNSATAAFLTNLVQKGHVLIVIDTTDPANNGSYVIADVKATYVDVATPFKKTISGANSMVFAVGKGAVLSNIESGSTQVPFDLPSSDSHSAATPATDVDLPGQAIQTAEIKDLAVTTAKLENLNVTGAKVAALTITDDKLNADRGKTAGVSVSGATPSTDISGAGVNANLNVAINGGAPQNLLIPDPSAFDLGAGAVALNTGARIAQALSLLASTLNVVFAYVTKGGVSRYVCYTTARGSTASAVITNGAGNNIADDLQMGAANGGNEYVGSDNLDLAELERIVGVQADNSLLLAQVPNLLITGGKIAAATITDDKLNADRGKTAGVSVSGATPSIDISGAGANADINVQVNGGAVTNLVFPDPNAFDLGGGAVPLNTGARIAQGLGILSLTAGLGLTWTYSTKGGITRYFAYSSTRGSASSVVVTAGTNDIAAALLLGVAGGGNEYVGAGSLDLAELERIAGIAAANSLQIAHIPNLLVTGAKIADATLAEGKLSFQPVENVTRLGSGHVRFVLQLVIGNTLTLAPTEIWTAANPLVNPYDMLAGGAGAAADMAAFIARLNAEATSLFRGVNLGNGVGAIWAKAVGTGNPVFAENTAGAIIAVTGAAGALTAADRYLGDGTFAVTAEHVAAWLAGWEVGIAVFNSIVQPVLKSFNIERTAGARQVFQSPINVEYRFVQSGANEWVLAVADVPAIMLAADLITFQVEITV